MCLFSEERRVTNFANAVCRSEQTGDGRYARMFKSLARVQLLILDDWAITPLNTEQRRDLMEIIDDRHDRASTIVTSQVPVEHWHEHIGNPTIADAVLDRLVHSAHRIDLKGESRRKLRAAKAKLDGTAVQEANFTRSRLTPLPGWDHRNRRLASIGTGGWFRAESTAAIIGMRTQVAARRSASAKTG